MPTNTDLVYQLPADFEVFGQAVDTSLADLKGGTSGQVLAKNSNTDMDFVWVAQDDSNAIQNAIVDAKGDLIGATAADTPARLAVGTNGQVLTADSTAATGLAWATPTGSSGPAFGAYRSGSNQSFSSSTWTKAQFNAEYFDTDNCYDSTTNYRFTPTKAGLYQISMVVEISSGSGNLYANLYKNGAGYTTWQGLLGSTFMLESGASLVSMNGTTDYLEVFVYSSGSSPSFPLGAVQFSGAWIRSN